MGINIHGISVGYLLCGPERWMVDRGPIYTERLFGAAMTKTDKSLFHVLRFLRATPFVFFVFCSFSGLACFVVFSQYAASNSLASYLG